MPTKGIIGTQFEHGAVAFFELEARMKLAVFPRNDLALDAKIVPSLPSSTEFSIGHLVNSKDEVDEVMESARKAGARIVKLRQDAFWGACHGYFQDPDGYMWEIIWNPSEAGTDT